MKKFLSRFVRCTVLKKDGLGEIHIHRRHWSRMIHSVWFQPEGRNVLYEVPNAAWIGMIDVETYEQAMALIRSN